MCVSYGAILSAIISIFLRYVALYIDLCRKAIARARLATFGNLNGFYATRTPNKPFNNSTNVGAKTFFELLQLVCTEEFLRQTTVCAVRFDDLRQVTNGVFLYTTQHTQQRALHQSKKIVEQNNLKVMRNKTSNSPIFRPFIFYLPQLEEKQTLYKFQTYNSAQLLYVQQLHDIRRKFCSFPILHTRKITI